MTEDDQVRVGDEQGGVTGWRRPGAAALSRSAAPEALAAADRQVGAAAAAGTIGALPALRAALSAARWKLAMWPQLRRVYVLALRCRVDVELHRVGRRGGHRSVWCFGRPAR